MNHNTGRRIVLQGLLLLAILLVVLPVVIDSGYTYLCEDDFTFEGSANDMAELRGAFLGAIRRTREVYVDMQGTWLFNFLIHYIRAYTRWGLPGFHAVMIFSNLLFLAGLFFLVKTLYTDRLVQLVVMLCAAICVYQLPGTSDNREIMLWYTGVFNFLIGMTAMVFATGFLIRCIREEQEKKQKAYLAVAAILAFLGSGVALEVTSANCSWLLAVLILNHEKVRRKKRLTLPFLTAFTGALINVCAPGNYIQESEHLIQGHETLADALRDTLRCYLTESRATLFCRTFVLVAGLLFIVCFCMQVKVRRAGISDGWMIALVFGVIAMQYFVAFPVCWGRHADALNYARVSATYKVISRLLYLFFILCLAQWAQERFGDRIRLKRVLQGGLAALALFFVLFHGRIIAEAQIGLSYMAFMDLMDGSVRTAYTTRAYVLSTLELLPEDADAHLTVPLRAHPRSAYGMGLTGDAEEFVNRSAAGLFHLHEVTVEYVD